MKKSFKALAAVGAIFCLVTGCHADALVDRAKARLSLVKDYKADLILNARMPGMAVTNMRMTLYYKRPNKVHIEAREGFAMLPEEGLYIGDPVEEALQNFSLVRVGEQKWQGRNCVKYKLLPKADAAVPMANARVFIDKATATPAGFTGNLPSFGDVTTVFTYKQFEGKYWLPVSTKFTVKNMRTRRSSDTGQNGSAELLYSGYKINTGLKDTIFKRSNNNESKKGS